MMKKMMENRMDKRKGTGRGIMDGTGKGRILAAVIGTLAIITFAGCGKTTADSAQTGTAASSAAVETTAKETGKAVNAAQKTAAADAGSDTEAAADAVSDANTGSDGNTAGTATEAADSVVVISGSGNSAASKAQEAAAPTTAAATEAAGGSSNTKTRSDNITDTGIHGHVVDSYPSCAGSGYDKLWSDGTSSHAGSDGYDVYE